MSRLVGWWEGFRALTHTHLPTNIYIHIYIHLSTHHQPPAAWAASTPTHTPTYKHTYTQLTAAWAASAPAPSGGSRGGTRACRPCISRCTRCGSPWLCLQLLPMIGLGVGVGCWVGRRVHAFGASASTLDESGGLFSPPLARAAPATAAEAAAFIPPAQATHAPNLFVYARSLARSPLFLPSHAGCC